MNYSTSFAVMPKDCNYLGDMVCGGVLLYEMDIAAAMATRRAMYQCPLNTALTVGVNNVKFMVGAAIGDLIVLEANVTKVGIKSITVTVKGHRENQKNGEKEAICQGEYVFVTVDENRKATPHNIKLHSITG